MSTTTLEAPIKFQELKPKELPKRETRPRTCKMVLPKFEETLQNQIKRCRHCKRSKFGAHKVLCHDHTDDVTYFKDMREWNAWEKKRKEVSMGIKSESSPRYDDDRDYYALDEATGKILARLIPEASYAAAEKVFKQIMRWA